MIVVAATSLELRQQAEHCRHLAKSQFDERLRSTLLGMAAELDCEAETARQRERGRPDGT